MISLKTKIQPIKGIIGLLLFLFLTQEATAQCNQNNFAVTELYFLDMNGKPFEDEGAFPIGTLVQGKIYAVFSGSSSNAYFPLHFSYKEEIEGDLSVDTFNNCVQNPVGTGTNQIPKNELVFLFNYEITWGNNTFFKDIFTRWRTNEGQTECSVSSSSGQCFSNPEGLRITTQFSTLPVEWQYFQGNFQNPSNSVSLNWKTNKEWEVSHFEIHRSENGIDGLYKIGEIESAGWSEKPTSYSFTDAYIPSSAKRLYYRIIQVDVNGSKNFSNTIRVDNLNHQESKQLWKVFPNPTKNGKLQLNFLGNHPPEDIQIRVFTANSIKSYQLKTLKSSTIDLEAIAKELPKGVFIIEVVSKDGIENHKIIRN